MKLRLLTLLAALLLCAPSHAQTIKSLGYNATNGNVVYGGTNPLTFTNPLQLSGGISGSTAAQEIIFASGTNAITFSGNLGIVFFGNRAAQFRTALGGTTVGNAVFTATNAAAGATALGLGTTNSVTFSNVTASGTLAVSNTATFSTNVSIAGSLSVGSFTTTTPSTWALDATQTAAATNGVLTLPSNANVIRLTNNNAISSVTNGVLGAFYYLVNQATNAVTISNVGGITIDGAQNLTLSPNESATLVATGATNVSVANRGDLTDVALGGTANTAPSQTASSGSSLMTRDLSDARYGEWISQTEMGQLEFTTATVSSTTLGGSYLAGLTNTLLGSVLRMYAFTNTGDYSVVNVNAASLMFLNSGGAASQGQGIGLYVRALPSVGANRVARIVYGGVSSNQVAGIVGTNGLDRRGFALEIAPTTNSSTNNLRLIAQDGTNGNVASAWVPVAAGFIAGSYFIAHSNNASRVYYGADTARPSKTPVITLNHVWVAGTGPAQPIGILFSVVNTNNDTAAGNLYIRGAWQMINADLVGY
jgi:hypothetical protein